MYPIQRNRRLRSSPSLRALVQEHKLSADDFIVPLFVIEGKQKRGNNPFNAWLLQNNTRFNSRICKKSMESGIKISFDFC